MIFFAWGSLIYFQEARPPQGAMEIYAVGKQWMWKFEHETGPARDQPAARPSEPRRQLIMSSQDVIHSFFVPAFRIKHGCAAGPLYRDLVPYDEGRHVSSVLLAILRHRALRHDRTGDRHGADGVPGVARPARVLPVSLAANGQELFQQLGCATCHRSDTQGRGPNLAGLFGTKVMLDDGRTVTADENYLRESILNPGAKIVAGFKPIMPSFQGQVSEESLMALVAYIKSLPQPQPASQLRPRNKGYGLDWLV